MRSKSFVSACLVATILTLGATPTRAADPGAAGLLSAVMPGAGEWYNRGFRGGFPWGECIVGYVCFLAHWSSIIDAVNGDSGENLRVNFWSVE